MSDPTPPSIRRPVVRRPRRHASSGAAYTETVVMLPFFAAVWACMLWVHSAYTNKLDALETARSCAWRHAYEACQSVPPGCSATSAGVASGDDGGVGRLAGILGPLGRPLLEALLGSETRIRVSRDVRRPRILGGGGTSVAGEMRMMCNTRPETIASIARRAFCAWASFC